MTTHSSSAPRGVSHLLPTSLFLSLLLASSASAQVVPRIVSGHSVGQWQVWDPAGGTPNNPGRGCPCSGFNGKANFFPGVGPLFKPVRPAGGVPGNPPTAPNTIGSKTTTISIGNAVGESVVFAGGEFSLVTASTLPSPGTIGGIISIMTAYSGSNQAGTLFAGGAPGTLPAGAGTPAGFGTNPLAASIPSDPSYMTFAGGTTTLTGFPAVPAASFMVQFAPVKTPSARFGGSAQMANFSPNNLRLDFTFFAGAWSRTNGSYGGVPIGLSGSTKRSQRRFQKTLNTAIKDASGHMWWGWDWTTGKVSAVHLFGNAGLSSWARTGSDSVGVGGLRSLSLVTPSISFGSNSVIIGPPLSGQAQLWTWNIQVLPEPGSAAGLVTGFGLLVFAYRRRGRSV